ncbi:hypothetical protein MJM04_35695, partial [Salmonella enterica subsp. enterica serovar Cerro]|nr:hypothetical protein [Salmonella enterica subsp. enterica serovar Cerro]
NCCLGSGYTPSSDQSSGIIIANDIAKGNIFLTGWFLSTVTFYYYLFDDISWISYYELGVNIPAVFDWDNHYAKGSTDTTRRML